jgi:glycosyltransferase involved in cell wall biosynthesis
MIEGGAAGAPPLRVLQVIDLLRPGVGVPETLRMMVEPARARGVEFTVAALHREPGDFGEELERAGVPVHDLDFKLWRGARRVFALRRIVRDERIAVVHANEARAIELALKARRLVPSLRVVGHLRVTGNVRSGSGRRERWLARNAPRLFEMVAVSQAVLSDFRDATGLKDGGRVILNGRPLERFLAPLPPAERASRRAGLGVPDGVALLLCAATLQPSKDHPTLLRAMAELGESERPFVLLLAGDGPDRAALEEQARALRLGERVRFLGRRDDVAELMKIADLYVMTSVREGLPGSVVEAQASGLPCVVTRCGGPEEVVADGVTGVVVPVGDAESVANVVAALLADEGRRATMSAAARANAKRFDLSRMIDEWVALYRAAATAPPS